MGTQASDKKILRQELRLRRQRYVGGLKKIQIVIAASSVLSKLQSIIDLSNVNCMGSYFPYKDEFDTNFINQKLIEQGIEVSMPCVSIDHSMEFKRIKDLQQVEPGSFGVLQPLNSAPAVQPEVLLVPLLGFDPCCQRIGYGKGHYDRYLQTARKDRNILAIGVGYDIQKVDKIPTEPMDQALDYIITEKEIYT